MAESTIHRAQGAGEMTVSFLGLKMVELGGVGVIGVVVRSRVGRVVGWQVMPSSTFVISAA